MSDLLERFDGKVGLALAGLQRRARRGRSLRRRPSLRETQAYVAKILGLLGGVGDLAVETFEVGLVE